MIKNTVKYVFLKDENVDGARNTRKKSDYKEKSGKLKGILRKSNDRLNDSGLGESFVGVCFQKFKTISLGSVLKNEFVILT